MIEWAVATWLGNLPHVEALTLALLALNGALWLTRRGARRG